MPTYRNNAVIWKNKDKNGNTYLAFKAERDIKKGESLNLFSNDKGGVETRPDFRSYDKIEDEAQAPQEAPEEQIEASSIPF